MRLVILYGNFLLTYCVFFFTLQVLHKAGHTHSMYATFNNGLAYEFLEGDTLTIESVRQLEIYQLVATRMAEMHLLRPKFTDSNDPESIIWKKTEKYMNLMPKKFEDDRKQLK